MKEEDRKKTIAGLMAYIGELQTSGVLESVPSDRLARVAKLIGEAAEIVSTDPTTFIPLFRDREVDLATGKKPTALEWFAKVWKPRVEAEDISSDDLRQTDPVLYTALATAQSRAGASIGDLLPISRRPLAELSKEEREQRRARLSREGAERMRRHRSKRTPD
jgi:hypothetical protein